jgi:hypothetical protein
MLLRLRPYPRVAASTRISTGKCRASRLIIEFRSRPFMTVEGQCTRMPLGRGFSRSVKDKRQ